MFLPPHIFVKVRKLVRHSLSLGFAAIPVATTMHAVYRLLHVTGSTNVNEWLIVEWLYTNIKTLAIDLLNDAEIFFEVSVCFCINFVMIRHMTDTLAV